MNKNFKEGDWVFCEFKLQQVMRVENGVVTEVSDASFRMSGSNLSDRCFPLSLHIKAISDTASYWMDEFHKLKMPSLNYPDLNRKIISMWVDMCENADDKDALAIKYKELDKFGRTVLERCRKLRFESIDDVNLFRR